MLIHAIHKVAVLGAGVMGAQIAAHFANAHIQVQLFDLKSESDQAGNFLVERALKELIKMKPSPLSSTTHLDYISVGNYTDNLEDLKSCDLIIEAVAERLEIKEKLYDRIAPFVKSNVIVASNTSGLSIKSLSYHIPDNLKSNFCGIHFFNPPRYMPLVELIPHATTNSTTLDFLETFLTTTLGKSVIRAKDTPNFIANRLGVFSMLITCFYAEKLNIPLEVVDQLTGKKLKRAKSATFRTADIVGLDVFSHVVETMRLNLKDGFEALYTLPEWIINLINQGALGQKTKKGLYEKRKDALYVFDLETKDYRLSDQKANPEVLEILSLKDWGEKLKKLRESTHPEAQFIWHTYREMFLYAATLVGDISNYPRDMDLAIRWGFGWQEGIFEIWQKAGWHRVIDWINEDIEQDISFTELSLPQWVNGLDVGVYADNQSFNFENKSLEKRTMLPVYARQIMPETFEAHTAERQFETLYENDGVKLWCLKDDDVGILTFKSKMCAIGMDVLNGIEQALEVAEEKCRAMVIWQEQDIFSVGANLEEFGFSFMMNGKDAVYEVIQKGHQVITQKLRYSTLPVVAAVKGFAFGGGCEIILHCDAAVAAHESYIGLVEAGVGIIPGWGGSKEMAYRASKADVPWKDFEKRYKNLAMAEVATSVYEAIEKGFLRESDTVVMQTKELLYVAIERARFMALSGYQPPLKKSFKVFGEAGIATVKGLLVNMRDGNQISAHDYKIASNLADAMCGGEIEKDTLVNEDWVLKRELENFVELALSEKSAARMQHMLETGKPLRN